MPGGHLHTPADVRDAIADAMVATSAVQLAPEDAVRAQVYALLGRLLAGAPDANGLAALAELGGDDSVLGRAVDDLAAAAGATDAHRVEREYHHLFIGVGRGELLPYASYYVTGFLHDRPLARLRGDMADLGIARADGVSDPEDHVAQVCEMMAGLIAGDFAAPLDVQRRFFERHLAPWADRFFADLERAEAASFYRAVARLGRSFLTIETDAFALAG